MTERTLRGRLVLDDRVVPGVVRISEDTIVSVEPDEADRIAAAGPYIAPGFVDVHVHGWGGHDAMGSLPDLDGMARALLRRGVTSFLPTAVTASLPTLAAFADRVRAWMPAAPVDGAAPLGFNLEGPFLSPARAGAQNPAHIRDAEDLDEAVLASLVDGLRLITVAPEIPGGLGLIARIAALGIPVSLGHSVATLAEARAGYAAGARSTTHLFNAMTGVAHHAPGLAVAALVDDAVYVELIADGHHVHPSLWPIVVRTKPATRLLLVSDALPVAGVVPEDGVGRAALGGLEVEVAGTRATLLGSDTLAGSVIALDSAVRHLVGEGIPLPAAVGAAAANPLRLLGIDDRGRLAPGLRADLVELDDELRVRRVHRAGIERAS